jgi:hypothetical protein
MYCALGQPHSSPLRGPRKAWVSRASLAVSGTARKNGQMRPHVSVGRALPDPPYRCVLISASPHNCGASISRYAQSVPPMYGSGRSVPPDSICAFSPRAVSRRATVSRRGAAGGFCCALVQEAEANWTVWSGAPRDSTRRLRRDWRSRFRTARLVDHCCAAGGDGLRLSFINGSSDRRIKPARG